MDSTFQKITASQDSISRLYNPEDTLFVEREWLIDKIKEFEQSPDKRHLIIVGEPGVGKSAMTAYLAHHRNFPRHFIRVDTIGGVSGLDPRSFLIAIGAQLCKKYGQDIFNQQSPGDVSVNVDSIEQTKIIGQVINKIYSLSFLPPRIMDVQVTASNVKGESEIYGVEIGEQFNIDLAIDELTLLHITLLNPVREIQKRYPNEKVLILINALDEASQHIGKNIIDIIPRSADADFPTNLRLVMTSRPGDHLAHFLHEDNLFLNKDAKEGGHREKVLEDAENYIQKQIKEKPLSEIFETLSPKIKTNFIAKVKESSDGNFLYLYHFFQQLLEKVKIGETDLEKIDAPKGLKGIYRLFLLTGIKKSVEDDIWKQQYRPILGVMAVAYEPLSKKQIAGFSGVKLEDVDTVINKITQFLSESLDERLDKKTYRFYHSSLNEYLLDNQDHSFERNEYHSKIASYYKEQSAHWENIDLKNIDQYGLLHLPKHLDAAGREEELYTLLTASPDWMNRKRDLYKSDRPYINDLELAINQFKDPVPSDQLLTLIKLNAARQVVQQRANAYQDTDLKTLIWLGRKTEEALSYARLRTNPEQKLNALLVIYNALQDSKGSNSTVLDEASNVLKEATEVAQNEIEDNSWSKKSLRKLVIVLIQGKKLDEAEEISKKIRNDSFEKVEVLGELATAFRKSKNFEKANIFFKRAEDITEEIDDSDSEFKLKSLLYLATTLANTKDTEKSNHLFSVAEDLTEKIEETEQISNKVKRLLDLAKALAHAGHKNKARPIFVKVRELATAIEDKNDWQRVEILRTLAISQAQSGNEFANESELVFDELEELAEGKAQSLLDLANDLAKAGNVKKSEAVFCKAINIPNSIEDGWQRTAILRMFVEELVGAGFTEQAVKYFEQARNAIQAISNENKFAKAEELRKLATALVKVPEQARKVFAEAEKLTPLIEQGIYAEEVLSQWAVILAEAGFPGKARAICHNFDKAKQQMDEDRKYPGEIIERAKSYANNRTLTKKRTKFLEEIDQARNSTEVREIAKIAIESGAFMVSTLGRLVIGIAEEMKFSTAKKVAYAIEDENNLKQIDVLRELAKVVAWLGYFREAFTIFGLKNGLIQFLDHLGYWIWASEKVEQELSLEILQETTRIFGWTYPYWGKISEQLVSASNSLYNKEKEELDSQSLHINNILTTIPIEQAQLFEACIQEAVDILYQNIAIREPTSRSNIKEAVLRQIIQSLNQFL